jgi:hypothetical protein
MPDGPEMVREHSERHGPTTRVSREVRHITLDLRIQIDASAFNQRENRSPGERFGDAGDAECHRRVGRNIVLKAGTSLGLSKHSPALVSNADRDRHVLLPGLKIRHDTAERGERVDAERPGVRSSIRQRARRPSPPARSTPTKHRVNEKREHATEAAQGQRRRDKLKFHPAHPSVSITDRK